MFVSSAERRAEGTPLALGLVQRPAVDRWKARPELRRAYRLQLLEPIGSAGVERVHQERGAGVVGNLRVDVLPFSVVHEIRQRRNPRIVAGRPWVEERPASRVITLRHYR